MEELGTTQLSPIETSLVYRDGCNWTTDRAQTLDELSLSIVTMVICLFGLVGNGIILCFLGCHIKRNPFTIYILNLAVTDFGFLLILFETFILVSFYPYTTSLCLLTAISVERCLSVLFPIWYRTRRSKHLSCYVCTLLWIFSTLLNAVKFFNSHIFIWIISLILNVIIIPCILVVSNLILFIRLQCGSQRHQPGRLYIVILLTVLFFLLFAVPFNFFIFVHFNNMVYGNIFLILASVNSSINPVIYFLVGSYRKRKLRVSVKVKPPGMMVLAPTLEVFKRRLDAYLAGLI
uniref:G-protein coupled receptors family 1 profile domain-containing protein n=1 Tax=Crocodylus porosus TaxID=8502 RepID=A0A7M4ETZ1_CROPO